MGQIIELGFGKANLSDTLATYASLKVSAPFQRVSAVTSGKQHGARQTASVGRHEMHGVLITSRSEHDNGSIILVQAAWKRKGVPIREGAVFLRLRDRGPQYRILAKVPTEADNVYGNRFMVFTGFADILNGADLHVAGISAPRAYLDRYMDIEELDECFEITKLTPEVDKRPTLTAISTPDGVQVKEIPNAPGRRLRLTRGG